MGEALICRRGGKAESEYAWKKYKTREVVEKTTYDTAKEQQLYFTGAYFSTAYTIENGNFVLTSPTFWDVQQQIARDFAGQYVILGYGPEYTDTPGAGTEMRVVYDGIYVPSGGYSTFSYKEVYNLITEEYDVTYVVSRDPNKYPNGEMADDGYYYVLVGGGETQYTPFEPAHQLFDASGSFSAPSAGTYRITAIGHGADGYMESYEDDYAYLYEGGAGGGGYIELELTKGESIAVTISETASTAANSAGTTLISATAGNQKTAGTVSGLDGVVVFPSNGTVTKDITPPTVYNDPLYISSGGKGGWTQTDNDDPTQSTATGGNGLFGGTGGDGGAAYYGVSYTYFSFSADGGVGGLGAGAGGDGVAEASTGTYGATFAHPGAGGGGGFGGGGGKGTVYDAGNYYVLHGAGKGAAGCVFIERIA